MKTRVVSVSSEVMGGTPVFKGTRVPVQTLIDYLEGGESIDDFVKGFPTVSREQVIELLEACGLPATHPAPPTDTLERLLAGDKKQSAREGLRWVLPERIGKMDINGRVTVAEITKWLE